MRSLSSRSRGGSAIEPARHQSGPRHPEPARGQPRQERQIRTSTRSWPAHHRPLLRAVRARQLPIEPCCTNRRRGFLTASALPTSDGSVLARRPSPRAGCPPLASGARPFHDAERPKLASDAPLAFQDKCRKIKFETVHVARHREQDGVIAQTSPAWTLAKTRPRARAVLKAVDRLAATGSVAGGRARGRMRLPTRHRARPGRQSPASASVVLRQYRAAPPRETRPPARHRSAP